MKHLKLLNICKLLSDMKAFIKLIKDPHTQNKYFQFQRIFSRHINHNVNRNSFQIAIRRHQIKKRKKKKSKFYLT